MSTADADNPNIPELCSRLGVVHLQGAVCRGPASAEQGVFALSSCTHQSLMHVKTLPVSVAVAFQ